MSFKLFVYYCAVCGGWAAFIGWVLGKAVAPPQETAPVARAVVQGLLLGLLVALSVGLVDTLWNASSRRAAFGVRVLAPVVVGLVGGAVGAYVGQMLIRLVSPSAEGAGKFVHAAFAIVGWTLTGLFVGTSVGAFDLFTQTSRGQSKAGAVRKIRNGLIGGALGGLAGGFLLQVLNLAFARSQDLLSPSAIGYVALGVAIGMLIALVQVILKEAWLKVEAGFRAGREIMLTKPETTIGRAESCDIGLFGDSAVERTHARIVLRDGHYLVADAGSGGGTFLNGEKVTQPSPLRSGDEIRVGGSVLRFGERRKRPTGA